MHQFLFCLGFLSQNSRGRAGGGGAGVISLTPLYHFYPLHRHLDISQAITAESSPLHIASFEFLITGRDWTPLHIASFEFLITGRDWTFILIRMFNNRKYSLLFVLELYTIINLKNIQNGAFFENS